MAFSVNDPDLTPSERENGTLRENGNKGSVMTFGDEELAEFRRLQQSTFRKYFFNMKQDDRYYQSDYGDDLIPREWQQRGFTPTVPPTAYNAVEGAADHILTNPEVTVPQRPLDGDYIGEMQLAHRKEDMLEFIWHNIFLRGNPLKGGKKKLIKEGKMVIKKQVRFDILDPEGIKMGRDGFAWRVDLVPNDTVYEDPDDPEDPAFVYEAYMMRATEARKLFPEAKNLSHKKVTDHIQYVEYWSKPSGKSKGKRVIWLDNERVIDKVNPYHWVDSIDDNGKEHYTGYVPYFITDSGWGELDAQRNPDRRYVGMVRHIHSLLEAEARQLTAADAQLRIATFPIVEYRGIAEDKENPLKLGPGAKIHLMDESQSIHPVAWPTLDPALFGILGRLHQYVNELAKFEQLGGMAQRGVDTATEADQNFQSASSKLSGPIDGLRSLISRVNASFLIDIEKVIEGPVTVFGASEGSAGVVTISPDEVDGYYETFVELKTSNQASLDRSTAMMWANLYGAFPGLDMMYAMHKAGIRRPSERMANRMMEDTLLDPRNHELRVMAALAGQGQIGQALQQAVLAQNIQTPPEGGEGGEGSFNANPIDESNPNPQANTGQEIRATAFGNALAANAPVGG